MANATTRTLDRVEKVLGNVTDYRAADALGVTRQTVSHWRKDRQHMADPTAIRAAAILGEDPGPLLAELQADRNDDPATKKHWTNMARKLRASAAVVSLAALGFTMFPSDGARSAEHSDFAMNTYYVKYEND